MTPSKVFPSSGRRDGRAHCRGTGSRTGPPRCDREHGTCRGEAMADVVLSAHRTPELGWHDRRAALTMTVQRLRRPDQGGGTTTSGCPARACAAHRRGRTRERCIPGSSLCPEAEVTARAMVSVDRRRYAAGPGRPWPRRAAARRRSTTRHRRPVGWPRPGRRSRSRRTGSSRR